MADVSALEDYKGREQAYVKHTLLAGYLERLFFIVGSSLHVLGLSELCYVDGFAGPWQATSDDLSGTSIAVALNAMVQTRDALRRIGKHVQYRALFIEKNAKAHARLQTYLQTHAIDGVVAESWNAEFSPSRERILQWCGARSFAFFFIDPTGWLDVGVNNLAPLLHRPNTEFLINFMYEFVNRVVPQPDFAAHVTDLLGEIPDTSRLAPEEKERLIVDTYREGLKAKLNCRGGRGYAASAKVLDRSRDRTKYHLVYVTCHPKGLIEFMTQTEKAMVRQEEVREIVKQEGQAQGPRQGELWPDLEVPSPNERLQRARLIEQFWLDSLKHGPKCYDTAAFARIVEVRGWYPGELQEALGRLIRQNRIRNRDAKRKRPKNPLNYEKGECLELSAEAA